jgi:hypothetical protein
VKRQLLVPVAVLGAAHAGDSRHTGQPARLCDETTRLAGDDVESLACHGARRAGGDARSVTPCASVAGRRRRRHWPIEDEQRAVGPPGPEGGVNLQPERPRSPQTRRAPEALKRNERTRPERKVGGMPDAERTEGLPRGVPDHPFGVAVERMGRAVDGLGLSVEAIEERGAARADDQRARRTCQQVIERQRSGRAVERRARQRKKDVQAESAQRTRQRREQIVG